MQLSTATVILIASRSLKQCKKPYQDSHLAQDVIRGMPLIGTQQHQFAKGKPLSSSRLASLDELKSERGAAVSLGTHAKQQLQPASGSTFSLSYCDPFVSCRSEEAPAYPTTNDRVGGAWCVVRGRLYSKILSLCCVHQGPASERLAIRIRDRGRHSDLY